MPTISIVLPQVFGWCTFLESLACVLTSGLVCVAQLLGSEWGGLVSSVRNLGVRKKNKRARKC